MRVLGSIYKALKIFLVFVILACAMPVFAQKSKSDQESLQMPEDAKLMQQIFSVSSEDASNVFAPDAQRVPLPDVSVKKRTWFKKPAEDVKQADVSPPEVSPVTIPVETPVIAAPSVPSTVPAAQPVLPPVSVPMPSSAASKAVPETPISSVNSSTNIAKEGEKEAVYIRDIEIAGVNVIKPEMIMNKLQFRTGDEYSRDMVQNNLKAIYQMGFFTERMKAVPVENPDGTVTLKIYLEENTPVSDFTVEGNEVVSTEEILNFLTPLQGEPQNIADINTAIEKIQEYYSSKGYILARIDSLYDDPDGVINVHLNEGEIKRILIAGNEKTKDYIVARNILTEAGMVYNENLIREDLVRLYATQAYKDVKREIEPSADDPEKYDVTIQVEEQRTASVMIGGGLDSATGLFGSGGIADNNFRGLNQRVALNLLAGSGFILNDSSIINHMNMQAELSFFEPYFMNSDNSLMNKIFFRDFGSYQIPLAIERRIGAEATIAHKVKNNKNLTGTLSLGLENVNVREGDETAIAQLYAQHSVPIANRAQQLEGGTFLSLSPGLIYDTRDTVMNPRHGLMATVRWDESLDVGGFDKTFGKVTGSVKKYVPIGKKSSLSFLAKAGGKIHGDMPEVMAYRLGGPYSIRGFRMSGVGTGDGFVMGSVELATPIPLLDRLKVQFLDNVRMTFFVDAGKIFNSTISDVIYDRPMQAVTAGVGLKIYIPGMGPLSVDYGVPILNPGNTGSTRGYFTFGVGDMMMY
ncbi:MAG TPA: BamA/TamA family outer membrane protein [Candidatus Gastranaerophilaceae bacterium]|nr:BamA/TamA family outer membrane protein [Candidatus Gastranaerophilaceae bacterium]